MSACRPWAWPLVPLYAAGLWLKGKLRPEPKLLTWPVISVGSISAGGAGKTPVVVELAKLLSDADWRVDVLSRGYGREAKDVARVDLFTDAAANKFGDEPVLIAEKTGANVWVGADRYAAGIEAEQIDPSFVEDAASHLHLLDDGFQHRQLFRNVDIVLVTLEDLDDALLPAGNRREPFSALRRADAVIVRAHERERVLPRLRPMLRADCKRWIIRRKLHFASPLAVLGAGLRPLAFCAIARPEDFQSMVKAAGCGLVDTLAFADHHRYTGADIDQILATAKKLNISGFVTTEKDAVKLNASMRERLATIGPLLIAELHVDFGDPAQVLGDLTEALG